MIRVLIADRHETVRHGLREIIAEPHISVVGFADSGLRVLTEAERLRPDVTVMSARLPNRSGIDVCSEMVQRCDAKVIITSTSSNDGVMLAAFSAGARGLLMMTSEPYVLRVAVRVVAGGKSFVDPSVTQRLVSLLTKAGALKGPSGLTHMEMRVLSLVPRGYTNVEIGNRLGIGEATVKTHLRHAMRKLQVKDRVEAAAIAVREGLA